ncbi:DUF4254 domain-containing protein [Pelotalea chapellei]|uniref:DUF4254 domain-containing protein n=1 Tax=Pelotalea chapellei TaxID=44671 RepID=A0ABS5U6T1_9BACT|nr:DUF4254 domain-containing protein [Pelotalea chapellei]MBT1071372.1 DUF4254 domain-containing protein [Pelotalea chapellei]
MLNDLHLAGLESAFDQAIEQWHRDDSSFDVLQGAVNPIALELAWRNHLLWHEEDKARRTDVDDSVIATVKRAIDKLNQQRNDQIEKLDEAILAEITKSIPEPNTERTNSETPGSIVDRISIMSLKVYHMAEDSRRDDIDDEHRQRSLHRLAVLQLQRYDLYNALDQLLADYQAGNKRMKLYKQFKMYNDPSLNPELYRQK